DLQTALNALPATDAWRVALGGIQEHHAAFLTSVNAQSPADIFGLPSSAAPAYAGDLARVVEDARLRIAAFKKTGAFELAGRNTLQQNLDDLRVDGPAISNLLSTTAATLTTVLASYTSHRDTLITRLSGEIDDNEHQNAITAQIDETLISMDDASD